jgi:hypothetical protein
MKLLLLTPDEVMAVAEQWKREGGDVSADGMWVGPPRRCERSGTGPCSEDEVNPEGEGYLCEACAPCSTSS